jgi:hypothetical protein
LTPAGEKWFAFDSVATDSASNDLGQWLARCADIVAQILSASNFNQAVYSVFADLAVFGTGGVYIEEVGFESDRQSVVNFVSATIGSFVFECGANGQPNALYRKLKMTACQLAENFGAKTLHRDIADCLGAGASAQSRTKEWEILHAVFRRVETSDHTRPRKGVLCAPARRPWASVFVDITHKVLIENGGMYEQPFALCRLFLANGEVFGRSPADAAMPDIMFLNELKRAVLVSVHKALNPTWGLPDDYPYILDNRPGGRIFYDAQKGANSIVRYPETGNVDSARAEAQEAKASIRRWFFADMFEMFTNESELRRQKTAEEVRMMNREKLARFAPLFFRISTEFLQPLLERVFEICARQQLLPPPPDLGGDISYTIVFQSRLALALRAVQSAALLDSVQALTAFSQLSPDVAHVVKWREAARDFVTNSGVNAAFIRSDAEIDAILDAQAQAAQQQQAMEMLEKTSGAVRNLGAGAQDQVSQSILGALQGQPGALEGAAE